MQYFKPDPKPEKPVLLEGKKKTEFRKDVYIRAGGLCESCGEPAPHKEETVFNVFTCGHVSHIRPRRIGGDVMKNVKWECYSCHIGYKHGPRWSKNERRQNRNDVQAHGV